MNNNNSALLKEFSYRVNHLYELEYGDFKRKVSQYINGFERQLNDHDEPLKKLISDLRYYVVYNPSGDIEMARLGINQLIQNNLEQNTQS